MNYSSPANNNTKDHVVAELPKPSKHECESEVLLEKGVRCEGYWRRICAQEAHL